MVGAGPAGSLAALRLARLGHRVLLLDRRRFPREKACGDALIPDAVHCLRRNGLYERIAAFGWPSRSTSMWSPSRVHFDLAGDFLCVKRELLDASLARAAAEAGAVCCITRVEEIADDQQEAVTVGIGSGAAPLRAKVVVVACGADVSLLRPHGMVQRAGSSAVDVRCYIESSYQIDSLIFSLDRSLLPGYAWIFPLGSGEYNVGCGVVYRHGQPENVDLRQMLERFLAEFPLARELRAQSVHCGPVRGALLRCGLTGTRPWNGRRVVAVGESIGATLPFTEEGIGKAMETAEVAADTIHEVLTGGALGRIVEYGERLQRELRPRYRGYEVAERWMWHPWMGDLVARRARRSAAVREAIEGIVSETVDPRRVFSLGGLVRTLIS